MKGISPHCPQMGNTDERRGFIAKEGRWEKLENKCSIRSTAIGVANTDFR